MQYLEPEVGHPAWRAGETQYLTKVTELYYNGRLLSKHLQC